MAQKRPWLSKSVQQGVRSIYLFARKQGMLTKEMSEANAAEMARKWVLEAVAKDPTAEEQAVMALTPGFFRGATGSEIQQLIDVLGSEGYETEDARHLVAGAFVGVVDNYISGGPGYVGKVMTVLWGGSPNQVSCYTFKEAVVEKQ